MKSTFIVDILYIPGIYAVLASQSTRPQPPEAMSPL
jgi:hypothetical protein